MATLNCTPALIFNLFSMNIPSSPLPDIPESRTRQYWHQWEQIGYLAWAKINPPTGKWALTSFPIVLPAIRTGTYSLDCLMVMARLNFGETDSCYLTELSASITMHAPSVSPWGELEQTVTLPKLKLLKSCYTTVPLIRRKGVILRITCD